MHEADVYNDIGKDRMKRFGFLFLGIVVFSAIYFSPPWPDAIDPSGNRFLLSREAKGALAICLLAAIWWVFEVVPIGVTSLTIGMLQVHFLIRPARKAFTDFMDPAVLFIFASLVIGMVFTKTGITRRMAYKMLTIVGEKTSMIYLGCFVTTAVLTHIMAHTAVAATVFPLLVSIHEFYESQDKPTRFGKGLFIGMAYVAGAGSIVTLLGAARGAVAIGLFRDTVGREVDFFELSYYMLPVGWIMVALLWVFIMLLFKPEKKVIPGLKELAIERYAKLGPMTWQEIVAAAIVAVSVMTLSLRSLVPELRFLNNTAIILTSTVLFFITGILDKNDLENMPWNIILLFAGAISIGLCLWETGAAQWLAVKWLVLFSEANWFVFVVGIAFFVMIMTNIIMNVAAIAISLPVALIIAPYLNVSPEMILFASLVTAGMPFLLLVGAAPNAIAYGSEQFTAGEFFLCGIPASIMMIAVLAFAVFFLWPLMGMPVVGP